MSFRRHALWLGVALATLCAASFAAEELTWKEANRRSAEALRNEQLKQGTEYARQSFDLYATQSTNYSPANHAQLLLNLSDAVLRFKGWRAALQELEAGIERVRMKAGTDPASLLPLWEEAVRIALRQPDEEHLADQYYDAATGVVERAWGADDPRSITLNLRWVVDLYRHRGFNWARGKLQQLRARSARMGYEHLVAGVDVNLAALEMTVGGYNQAIPLYTAIIERLEAKNDPQLVDPLRQAYAGAEYAHQAKGNAAVAAAMHERLRGTFVGGGGLWPLVRTLPRFPPAAAKGPGGSVTLRLTIGADGRVREATVLASTPPGVFDQASLDAVKQWQFKPKVVDGKPVEAEGIQQIDFKPFRFQQDPRSLKKL